MPGLGAPPGGGRRRTLVAVAALALLLIGGFVAVYLDFFNNDSPDLLALR